MFWWLLLMFNAWPRGQLESTALPALWLEQEFVVLTAVSGLLPAGLRGQLPESIALPASVTVPFGSFEEVLKDGANKDVAQRLKAAVDKIPSTHAEPALADCRAIVMEVIPLDALWSELYCNTLCQPPTRRSTSRQGSTRSPPRHAKPALADCCVIVMEVSAGDGWHLWMLVEG